MCDSMFSKSKPNLVYSFTSSSHLEGLMCLWASPTLLTEPKVFWALLRPSLLGVWFVRIKVGLRDWDVSAKEQSKPRALVDFINCSCIICYSWRWSILHSLGVAWQAPVLVVSHGKFVKASILPPQGKDQPSGSRKVVERYPDRA